jgi:CBS domain-containing protein
LPVLEGQKLVGVVSIGDLVKAKIDHARQEADAMRAYIATG